jgi:hypothetical protein
MIQSWAIAFYPRRHEIPIYYNTYRHLVRKGFYFGLSHPIMITPLHIQYKEVKYI